MSSANNNVGVIVEFPLPLDTPCEPGGVQVFDLVRPRALQCSSRNVGFPSRPFEASRPMVSRYRPHQPSVGFKGCPGPSTWPYQTTLDNRAWLLGA